MLLEVYWGTMTGSNSFADKEGYQFSVSADLELGELQKDVTNDKPGFSSLLIPINNSSVTFENKTEARAAPATFGTANNYYLLYPTDSAACALERARKVDARYCAFLVSLSGSTQSAALKLDAGGSEITSVAPFVYASLGYPDSGPIMRIPAIPDASWDAALPTLTHPAGLVMTFGLQIFLSDYAGSLCRTSIGGEPVVVVVATDVINNL